MPTPSDPVDAETGDFKGCSIKRLPKHQWVSAATRAVAHNPANAPMQQMLEQGAAESTISRGSLSLLTAKYWGPVGVHLNVSFVNNPPRGSPRSHLEAYERLGCVCKCAIC